MAYKPPHARQTRVNRPGNRRMELMPSLSRSSGLDKDGDALRDHNTQREYRTFIEGKVGDLWKRYPYGVEEKLASEDQRHRQEQQENILILFRKLREGLLASDRKDAFALEVYETSLYLSILFHSDKQTTSVLSHLPCLYLAQPSTHTPSNNHRALSTTLLSLLYQLLQGYPSQSRYHEQFHSLPHAFLPRDSAAYCWLIQLTRCLRARNYARLQELTDRRAYVRFFPASESKDKRRNDAAGQPANLALEAMGVLVDGVRAKARATAWLVIRSAYRELHCVPPPADASVVHASTSEWLARALALGCADADVTQAVNVWLEQKRAEGEVRGKEGAEGRWIICKVLPVKT